MESKHIAMNALKKSISISIMLAAMALFASGCSVSYSLEKSSDSVSKSSESIMGSFESISASSSGSDESVAMNLKLYQDDVAGLVSFYVKRHGKSRAAFENDLNQIARSHGITNWETMEETYEAIGRGLSIGGVSVYGHSWLLDEGLMKRYDRALKRGYGVS
ncbi:MULTISPECIES: putative lipoprotein [Desulfosediminicola]|uniref:putative lipoprotein n=1 Tax=Desulfosediminicola TaxID=2886823 RepID=UPI0010ADA13C|nr:putative lipoprotein [Desulfosediminicola ganghwensis]